MRSCMVLVGMVALLSASAVAPASAGTVDPGLEQILASRDAGETVSVLVFIKDRVDIEALSANLDRQRATLNTRHQTVVTTLQQKAEATQGTLRDFLKELQIAGRVEQLEGFWIANVFRVEASISAIREIAKHPDVDTVYFNYEIELIEPVSIKNEPRPAGPRSVEPGVAAVNAPEAWALGFTGEGIIVANMDTGVDGNHPALASRWAGVADPRYAGHPEWAWYDPYAGQNDFPYDNGGHGTHTMGSVCGGAPGDEVGVAPGAIWIATAPIDRGGGVPQTVADAILSFQWLADPDGNPGTSWDVPAVCSNSWGVTTSHGYPPCDETFWTYIDACEAAGVVVLFSAGNEGTSGLRRPADRATTAYNCCAVASVDANYAGWPIAASSSRGPTYCTPTGEMAIKPDIAAPGVNVRSSYPGGGYTTMSGTSMASPHVNGVVALIRQACPDLSVDEVKEVIYETAYDLGSAGEDNAYGWGMVDALAAVNEALDRCGDSPPRAYDGFFQTAVDTPVAIELRAQDHDGGPSPISWEIVTLPAQQLADAGNGHVITAGELPYTLTGNGNYVTYTPSGGFYGEDVFTFRATDGGTPPEGGYSEIATVTGQIEFGPPTIVTATLPDGCLNQSYGPVQMEASQGQPELVWSLISDEYEEIDTDANYFQAVGTAMGWHSDDNSWSYTLPFAFPFFTNSYTAIHVSSNGLIDFGSGDSDWSNSDAELISNARIAGLWDDLRTDGGSDDIFIDATVGGQVTVRWDCVTYSGANAVDFSVVLYEDGTIRFNYGPSNSSITPTIGISAGDGSHYLFSTYNNAGNLTSADTHDFVQPVPLPAGLTLSPAGLVSGTPTEMGTFAPRFRVTDALDRSDVRQVSLTIEEECQFIVGDMNCDGAVDFDDIDAFVLALAGQAAYEAAYPACNWLNADCDSDGDVDFDDIDAFVALLGQ